MIEWTQEQFEAVASARYDAEQTIPMNLVVEPSVPSFPVDALPAWWARYVTALAEATQTPVDLAGSVTLGIIGAAVGGRYEIEPTSGWIEPTNLYTVVALPPGNRKSAVVSKATAPLRDLERDLISELRPIVAEERARYDLLVDRAEKARRDALKSNDPGDEAHYLDLSRQVAETVVPPMPRLIADDVTPEAIASLAASQGGRIAIAAPEGGIFDIFAGRYTGGVANNEVLLRGHAGDSYVIDRKGRESETIDKLIVSFILTVQPSVLRQIGDNPVERSRGELERFLYAVPVSNVGRRNTRPRPVPHAVNMAYVSQLSELARSAWMLTEPVLLTFDPGGQEAFYEWSEEMEVMLAPDGDLGDPRLVGWGSKLAGATARLAAILHVAERHDHSVIPAKTVNRAKDLAGYYIGHAKAAFQLMQVTDPYVDEKKVLRFLKRHGAELVTGRDVFEMAKGTFKRMDLLQPILDSLVEMGWLHPVTVKAPAGRGRRPSPLYLVHPHLLCASTTSRNSHNSRRKPDARNSANTENTARHAEGMKPDSCRHGTLPSVVCQPCRAEAQGVA